jgi:Protein of unknown function (DUF1572)
MSNSNDEIGSAFIDAARNNLAESMSKIEHCVGQLSDEQIWWRPRAEMNSIANLMLHLSGNVRQWIVAGVGRKADIRNRPKEFSDKSGRTKAEILGILKAVVGQADATLESLKSAQLTDARRIQGYDTTVLKAIFDCLPHFRGHAQEIIHMTREQLGDRYQFDFVPKGKEQEAAGGPAI